MPKKTSITETLLNDTGTSATDDITSNDTLTGHAPGRATITFSSGGSIIGMTIASPSGNYTFTPPRMADGQYTVTAAASGATQMLSFTLDTTPPTLSEALANDTAGNNTTTDPTLTGTAEAATTTSPGQVTLKEGATSLGTTSVNSNGTWTFTPVGLTPGTHTVTASETDLAGNTGSTSVTFTLQSSGGGGTGTVPAYSHVVVVVEENHDYNQIIGDTTDAPYINSLAANGALLTNYDAITHPSEPNYFALYAGSTFGVTDDNFHSEPDPTLATVLQHPGLSFIGYVEGGATDMNHTPWEYFPEGTSVERDFSTFPSRNFALLPAVSFVIPNVNDDMHNGTIAQGDAWLKANIDSYAQWAKTNNSLLIVTWDENDGTSDGNHVATILSGAHVVPGSYGTAYNHYNLLSTTLAPFGLTGPNNAANAAPFAVFG